MLKSEVLKAYAQEDARLSRRADSWCCRCWWRSAVFLLWHFGTTVPVGGEPLINPFFFSTPVDVIGADGARLRDGSDLEAPLDHAPSRRCSPSLIGAAGGHRVRLLVRAAGADGGRVRPLREGGQRAAAGGAGADLRALVRPRDLVEGGAGRHAGLLHRVLQRLPGREGGQPDRARQRADARHDRTGSSCGTSTCPRRCPGCSRSLHTSVGFALVGAVVGEYLGSAAGLGYRIAQAEGVFDVTGVFSGMLVLTIFVILIDMRGHGGRETAAGLAAGGGVERGGAGLKRKETGGRPMRNGWSWLAALASRGGAGAGRTGGGAGPEKKHIELGRRRQAAALLPAADDRRERRASSRTRGSTSRSATSPAARRACRR